MRALFLFLKAHVSAGRHVVPRVAFPTEPFSFRAVNHFVANKREKTDTNPAFPPSARQLLPDEMHFQGPHMESTTYAPLEDSPTIAIMSDPTSLGLDGFLMDPLNDGIEKLQSEGGRHFHGHPSVDGSIRVCVASVCYLIRAHRGKRLMFLCRNPMSMRMKSLVFLIHIDVSHERVQY